MKSQINWNNKIIEIQIISIVRVSEHFSKMLVLSGVYNTRILDTMNYVNQDYMHVNYTLIFVYSMLLVTGSLSKTSLAFAWIWPNSDRWLVNHCAMPSIGQTWVLVSIGAVAEMGILSTLKRLLMEPNRGRAPAGHEGPLPHFSRSQRKIGSESTIMTISTYTKLLIISHLRQARG
jgi:hypothetical protein